MNNFKKKNQHSFTYLNKLRCNVVKDVLNVRLNNNTDQESVRAQLSARVVQGAGFIKSASSLNRLVDFTNPTQRFELLTKEYDTPSNWAARVSSALFQNSQVTSKKRFVSETNYSDTNFKYSFADEAVNARVNNNFSSSNKYSKIFQSSQHASNYLRYSLTQAFRIQRAAIVDNWQSSNSKAFFNVSKDTFELCRSQNQLAGFWPSLLKGAIKSRYCCTFGVLGHSSSKFTPIHPCLSKAINNSFCTDFYPVFSKIENQLCVVPAGSTVSRSVSSGNIGPSAFGGRSPVECVSDLLRSKHFNLFAIHKHGLNQNKTSAFRAKDAKFRIRDERPVSSIFTRNKKTSGNINTRFNAPSVRSIKNAVSFFNRISNGSTFGLSELRLATGMYMLRKKMRFVRERFNRRPIRRRGRRDWISGYSKYRRNQPWGTTRKLIRRFSARRPGFLKNGDEYSYKRTGKTRLHFKKSAKMFKRRFQLFERRDERRAGHSDEWFRVQARSDFGYGQAVGFFSSGALSLRFHNVSHTHSSRFAPSSIQKDIATNLFKLRRRRRSACSRQFPGARQRSLLQRVRRSVGRVSKLMQPKYYLRKRGFTARFRQFRYFAAFAKFRENEKAAGRWGRTPNTQKINNNKKKIFKKSPFFNSKQKKFVKSKVGYVPPTVNRHSPSKDKAAKFATRIRRRRRVWVNSFKRFAARARRFIVKVGVSKFGKGKRELKFSRNVKFFSSVQPFIPSSFFKQKVLFRSPRSGIPTNQKTMHKKKVIKIFNSYFTQSSKLNSVKTSNVLSFSAFKRFKGSFVSASIVKPNSGKARFFKKNKVRNSGYTLPNLISNALVKDSNRFAVNPSNFSTFSVTGAAGSNFGFSKYDVLKPRQQYASIATSSISLKRELKKISASKTFNNADALIRAYNRFRNKLVRLRVRTNAADSAFKKISFSIDVLFKRLSFFSNANFSRGVFCRPGRSINPISHKHRCQNDDEANISKNQLVTKIRVDVNEKPFKTPWWRPPYPKGWKPKPFMRKRHKNTKVRSKFKGFKKKPWMRTSFVHSRSFRFQNRGSSAENFMRSVKNRGISAFGSFYSRVNRGSSFRLVYRKLPTAPAAVAKRNRVIAIRHNKGIRFERLKTKRLRRNNAMSCVVVPPKRIKKQGVVQSKTAFRVKQRKAFPGAKIKFFRYRGKSNSIFKRPESLNIFNVDISDKESNGYTRVIPKNIRQLRVRRYSNDSPSDVSSSSVKGGKLVFGPHHYVYSLSKAKSAVRRSARKAEHTVSQFLSRIVFFPLTFKHMLATSAGGKVVASKFRRYVVSGEVSNSVVKPVQKNFYASRLQTEVRGVKLKKNKANNVVIASGIKAWKYRNAIVYKKNTKLRDSMNTRMGVLLKHERAFFLPTNKGIVNSVSVSTDKPGCISSLNNDMPKALMSSRFVSRTPHTFFMLTNKKRNRMHAIRWSFIKAARKAKWSKAKMVNRRVYAKRHCSVKSSRRFKKKAGYTSDVEISNSFRNSRNAYKILDFIQRAKLSVVSRYNNPAVIKETRFVALKAIYKFKVDSRSKFCKLQNFVSTNQQARFHVASAVVDAFSYSRVRAMRKSIRGFYRSFPFSNKNAFFYKLSPKCISHAYSKFFVRSGGTRYGHLRFVRKDQVRINKLSHWFSKTMSSTPMLSNLALSKGFVKPEKISDFSISSNANSGQVYRFGFVNRLFSKTSQPGFVRARASILPGYLNNRSVTSPRTCRSIMGVLSSAFRLSESINFVFSNSGATTFRSSVVDVEDILIPYVFPYTALLDGGLYGKTTSSWFTYSSGQSTQASANVNAAGACFLPLILVSDS